MISPISPFKIPNTVKFIKNEPSFKGIQESSGEWQNTAIPYYPYQKNNSGYFIRCEERPSEILSSLGSSKLKKTLFLFEEDENVYLTKPEVYKNDLNFLKYIKESKWVDFDYKDIGTYAFSPEAREQSTRFANEDVSFGEKLVDGFRYTNIGAEYDEIGQNIHTSGSGKITIVDKSADEILAKAIDVFKKRINGKALDDKAKIAHVFNFVNEVFAKCPYGDEEVYIYCSKTRASNPKKEILLGDVMNTGEGVCRHKVLLAKVLGDEIGLQIKIVGGRKNYGPHAWSEVMLNNVKYLFDPYYFSLINLDNPPEIIHDDLSLYSKKYLRAS